MIARTAVVTLVLTLAACGPAEVTDAGERAPAATARIAEPAPPATVTSEAGLEVVPVTIETAKGSHRFQAEVARSPEQQERGLMFRTALAEDSGMIFPFIPPREASFWMKDTLIPLDMIFIRSDGSIARIAADVPPQTLDPVVVTEPVAAVLEIPGGRAAALGIDTSARVRW